MGRKVSQCTNLTTGDMGVRQPILLGFGALLIVGLTQKLNRPVPRHAPRCIEPPTRR